MQFSSLYVQFFVLTGLIGFKKRTKMCKKLSFAFRVEWILTSVTGESTILKSLREALRSDPLWLPLNGCFHVTASSTRRFRCL